MLRKIIHAVIAFVLFLIPLLLNSKAQFLDVSIGAILNLIYLSLSQWVSPTTSA